MSTEFIKVNAGGDDTEDFYDEFVVDLKINLGDEAEIYEAAGNKKRDGSTLVSATNIIIALGSAGVFTTLYQVISSYLGRNKERELVFETNGAKVVIKGHSLPEEQELIKQLKLKQQKSND